MPRAMAVIGITFAFSLWVFLKTSLTVAIVIAVIAAAVLTVSMAIASIRKHIFIPTVCITVMASAIVLVTHTKFVYETALSLEGDDAQITGTICDLPYRNSYGSYCYTIKTESVRGIPCEVRILVSSDKNLKAEPCDKLSFTGNIYIRGGDDKEMRDVLMSEGIWLGAYSVEEIKTQEGHRNLRYYILKAREFTREKILDSLPEEEASVLVALLLGDTSNMSDDAYNDTQRCGILHLFAVSGFNLSLFSMMLLRFLERKKMPRAVTVLLPSMLVVFIMALTGFSQSCVRAGIMLLVMLFGKLLSKRSDSLNSLGFSAFLICFADPFQALSIGFQLSFLASATVIFSIPLIEEKLISKIDLRFKLIDGAVKYILSTFLVSICVGIAVLPIMIFCFDGVSLIAPLVNCFTVIVAEWEMMLGFTGVLFGAFGFLSFITNPIFFLTGIMSRYILNVSEFFSSFKYSFVDTEHIEIKIWMLCMFVVAAFILLFDCSKRKKLAYMAITATTTLAFSLAMISLSSKYLTTITAVSAENRACAVVAHKNSGVVFGEFDDYASIFKIKELVNGKTNAIIISDTKKTEHITDLLHEIQLGVLVVPKKDIHTLPFSKYTTPIVAEDYSLKIDDVLSVSYRHTELGSAMYVKLYGNSVLMITRPGCDTDKLPIEWQSADILYTVSDIPPKLDASDFDHIILSASEERAKKILPLIEADGGIVTYTGEQNVTLTISREGFYDVKRVAD